MKNTLEGIELTLWKEQNHWRQTDLDLILFLSSPYHLCGVGQTSLPPWASVSSSVR